MERKLTAILCADVYRYSRLMGQDEEATLRTLSSYRKLVDSLIEHHRGRFVNSAGDSVLAEFASVVNAVQCAVEIQNTLKAENAEVQPDRRMQFRIGVNVGDVMVEGEQIYGDGVNVAARLESLAEPGGICISGIVHDQIRDKLAFGYQDLGDQEVKNIARPVRVYRVLPETDAAAPGKIPRVVRRGVLSIIVVAIVVGAIVVVQHMSLKPPRTLASIPSPPTPALALPDKPSIAVLPFANISGDQEQDYFSDGLTNDLTTDLSRLPDLFVIAPSSAFTYKGKPTKLQEVSKELGVKYVLEGGVRRGGDQVRITVQLADATTGMELWAERYDRSMRDVFALQDEIVHRIVTTLNLQLTLAKQGRFVPRMTENPDAYEDVLRGVDYAFRFTKDANAKARQMFEEAIALDPKYAEAYSALGGNYFLGWNFQLSPDRDGLSKALQLDQQAIALDDSIAFAHSLLSTIYVEKGLPDQALAEARKSIKLEPNFADGYSSLANVMNLLARPAEALQAVEKAIRLDPRHRDAYLYPLGWAYTQLGRYEEAIPTFKTGPFPSALWTHVHLAQDYIELGREDEARAEAAAVEGLIATSPDPATGYLALAAVMHYMAEPERALAAMDKAINLDPANRDNYYSVDGSPQGWAYTSLGRYDDAISA
ncbi:MAG: adenylate/guanylate cyclase domain-containing protein, partial [Deltaproteobacteria bacterium]|nr:adenylate/guanylate cyclase domain-containing protein [Deltaproteobacteria bacterium]